MRNRRSEPKLQLLEEAVGRAAIRVQQAMRENLERMVYAQPTSPSGYTRTYTLMRATHAARPDADHSSDESRAAAGEDLAANSPSEVVERRGNQIMSEIGAWISYSDLVHSGVNQPQPRPFVAQTAQVAERALQEEVERAVRQMMTAA